MTDFESVHVLDCNSSNKTCLESWDLDAAIMMHGALSENRMHPGRLL